MKNLNLKAMALTAAIATLFSGILHVYAADINLDDLYANVALKLGLFNTSIHPKLERREKNEQVQIKNASLFMSKRQMVTEPEHRDAHAKAAGCAVGIFEVVAGIPEELQNGIFKAGKSYPIIARFSNGAGISKADDQPDARGMAMKLIGAAGSGNLLGAGTNQDFLLVNQQHFFLGSIASYARFNQVQFEDKSANRFFLESAIFEALAEAGMDTSVLSYDSLKPVVIAIATKDPQTKKPDPKAIALAVESILPGKAQQIMPVLGAKLAQMQNGLAPLEMKLGLEALAVTTSNLNETYTSMTSFLLASKKGQDFDTAVKYIAKPVDCKNGLVIKSESQLSSKSPTLLRENLDSELSQNQRCFNFYIQALPVGLNDDQKKDLVEDARKDYLSPEVLAARIVFDKQSTNIPSKLEYCENLSFNPWQSASEHQPIGVLNRARKVAVTISSIRRHLHIGTQRAEPTSVQDFQKLK